MKKIFILSVIYLFLSGCSYQRKDKSLDDLREVLKNEIDQSLQNFDRRYALDPVKAKKAHYIAYGLNDNFNLIYLHIESGKLSKDSIQKYLQNGLEYYGDKNIENNSTLKNRVQIINQALNTRDAPNQRIEFLICELENILLLKTYQEIDKNAFKFNDLKAIVVPEKTEIKLGETFQAKIYMAAFDTTRWPMIKFKEEDYLPIEDGCGILRIKGTSRGIKKYTGNIEWNKDGESKTLYLPYNITYTVR
jgi:hypothetical protein